MRAPVLGDNVPGSDRCQRTIRGGLCMNIGTQHIVWKRLYASVTCDACAEFAEDNLEYLQMHPLTPLCLQPDTLWYRAESCCRRPEKPEDYVQGEVLLDN